MTKNEFCILTTSTRHTEPTAVCFSLSAKFIKSIVNKYSLAFLKTILLQRQTGIIRLNLGQKSERFEKPQEQIYSPLKKAVVV